MTKAFKCDRCDEFEEGSPNRWDISKYLNVNMGGWSSRQHKFKWELCNGCQKELADMIEEWESN